jgi:hypothetical protein
MRERGAQDDVFALCVGAGLSENVFAQCDDVLQNCGDRGYNRLRVDSRTASSGATLRCTAATSRFS